MLEGLLCVQNEPSARHSPVVATQEVHECGGGIIPLRGRAYASDPLVKRDQIGDIERVGQDGVHLAPGLADWVIDVVDRIGCAGRKEEVGESGRDVVDGRPVEGAVDVGKGIQRLRRLDQAAKVFHGVPIAARFGAGNLA